MAGSRGAVRWLPFHYGWVVVALTFMTVLTAAGVRAGLPVFIQPLEAQWGWSRASLASAISLNLLLYGVASPIAGRLIDRYGPRRVMMASLTLLALGAAGTVAVRSLWQLTLVWGVAIGVGAGGAATVVAASVATRWFVARRGLVVGLLNSASSTGQLIFLPVLMGLVVTVGWQAGVMLLAVVSLGLVPILFLLMRDEPAQLGLRPYGADHADRAHGGMAAEGGSRPFGEGDADPSQEGASGLPGKPAQGLPWPSRRPNNRWPNVWFPFGSWFAPRCSGCWQEAFLPAAPPRRASSART